MSVTNAMTLPNIVSSASAKAASAGALTYAQSSMLTGQIGNIDAYISAVNRIPMLSPSEQLDAPSASASAASAQVMSRGFTWPPA